jgi:hypothetical protein
VGARPRLRDDDRSGDQRPDDDRDVDEKDGAPPPAEEVGLGEHTAEDEPDRRREAERRAVDAECGAALLAGEHRPEGGEHLGGHRRRRRALDDACGDQLVGGLGDARSEAGGAEDRRPDQEQALAAEQVAEAAGRDQGRGEGEHVGRDDPFQLGAGRAQVAPDRGQGDVHDRAVDQVDGGGHDHHGRRQPSPRVAGSGSVRCCVLHGASPVRRVSRTLFYHQTMF